VEAFNHEGQEYGEGRWLEAIWLLPKYNAEQALQSLMKSVDDYVVATRQSDDITCLVFRAK